MNERDIDALVLKHFGFPVGDQFNAGGPLWHHEFNQLVRDNSVLREAVKRTEGLNHFDNSATAVLARTLFVFATELAKALRDEMEAAEKVKRCAKSAEKSTQEARAILEGISSLEHRVAKAS